MTIFDLLNSILHSKKRIDVNLEDENIFSPFMINRWVSMYNGDLTCFVNNFLNRMLPFDSKEGLYNFYFNLIPKLKFKRISYIKKAEKKESDLLPTREFISRREMLMYVDLLKS